MRGISSVLDLVDGVPFTKVCLPGFLGQNATSLNSMIVPGTGFGGWKVQPSEIADLFCVQECAVSISGQNSGTHRKPQG